MFVAAALCEAAAGSASAGWFVEGSELAGTAALATTATVDEAFKLEVPLASTSVKCAGSTLSGTSPEIAAPNRMAIASITFSACKTEGSGGCTLPGETISTLPLVAELAEQTYPEDTALFAPKTKRTLAALHFEGEKCALLGVQPVTATKLSAILPTGQEELTAQLIRVKTTKGELKVGSDEAELTGSALLKLASGKRFAFLGGTAAFLAENPANDNGIELQTVPEAGTKLEFALEKTTNNIKCTGVTYAAQTINLPRALLDLKPTFPAKCEGFLGGEFTNNVTVGKCKVFELKAASSFGFAEACEFKIPVTANPECIVTVEAQNNLNTVTYTSTGNPKNITAKIAAAKASYKTNSKCAIANGDGELKTTLIISGFKPAGTQVSIDVG